ncbi:hypothetical protein ACFXPZ_22400 [Streptomyces sp. NPDC059101]|uniref:hypothetical protein n=1 Tax=Streptomyces sp. NPDC059101 TaxID=3346728 RepID=UPI0036C72DDE
MTDRDPLGVTIGAREIYDEVVGLREDVRSVVQNSESVRGTLTDHEDRLRALERWKYALPLALLTALGTAAAELLRILP